MKGLIQEYRGLSQVGKLMVWAAVAGICAAVFAVPPLFQREERAATQAPAMEALPALRPPAVPPTQIMNSTVNSPTTIVNPTTVYELRPEMPEPPLVLGPPYEEPTADEMKEALLDELAFAGGVRKGSDAVGADL